jgi:hypothetical protein
MVEGQAQSAGGGWRHVHIPVGNYCVRPRFKRPLFKAPNYRIDKRNPGLSLDEDSRSVAYKLTADYNGLSHGRLVIGGEPEDILRETHWSTACMTYAEVQALLREIRKK